MIPALNLKSLCVAALFCFICLGSGVAHGQLLTLETEQLRLIYFGKAHEYLVSYAARCLQNSLEVYRRLYEYEPEEKITLVLYDFSDHSTAGTGTVPKNHITMTIAPTDLAYEIYPANERFNTTLNHEMAHIVTMDKATGRDRFFRTLFGGKVNEAYENPLSIFYSQLTTPRRNSPRWYREGIAVFMETWMAGGLGRALGSYDEMVFRTMVRDSIDIFDLLTLESVGTEIDFQQGTNAYLYGTRFMSYLAFKYGPEKLIDWTSRSANSKAFYISQFKKTYGRSIHDAWREWIKWEEQFQQGNLELIRQHPTTPYRTLFPKDLGWVSRAYYVETDQKLYAAIDYPGQVAHITALDLQHGTAEKICDIKGPAPNSVTSLAFDPATQTLFYTTDNEALRDLRAVDIKSKKSRTLLRDARIGDLVFNATDRSIWGIRHFNGISTLVRIPFPYKEWNQVYSWPFGTELHDIDISPSGRHLVGRMAEISGRQTLVKFETEKLLKGDAVHETLFDFEVSSPLNFVFSQDGGHLYGSSYYTGLSNIFRYDLANGEMDAVSNCETGFFRPIPIADDSLIALRYTARGFSPVKISNKPVEDFNAISFLGQEVVENHPVVQEWIAGSPTTINLDSLTTYSGAYHGFKNIGLAGIYPIVEGYKDYPAFGMRMNLAGPVGLHHLNLTGSYTPNRDLPANERWHANIKWRHLSWTIDARYNYANFYDLFGPTKVSLKGYSLRLRYEKTLLNDYPRRFDYVVEFGGYAGIDRLPDAQNIGVTSDKLVYAIAGLNYENLKASLGAVDHEKGFKWEVIAQTGLVHGRLYPRIYTNYDFGFALPLNHSSVWFRGSSGYSYGKRFDAFANFFFGGFGNNWVDYLPEKRYREYYSFPGTELNELPGTNYSKALVEWNLPPLRFRGIGVPGFYSPWARISLFATGLMTNPESEERIFAYNVGAQIDFRTILFSRMEGIFSLGYATAYRNYRGFESYTNEFMLSFKIL